MRDPPRLATHLGSPIRQAIREMFEADCGAITRIKYLEKDGTFLGKAFLDFESVEAGTKVPSCRFAVQLRHVAVVQHAPTHAHRTRRRSVRMASY